MTKPWTPQHAVSPQLATNLIESQFPELSPLTIKPLGAGWDNTVYLVNNKYAFRFPRREIATTCLHYEIAVLPKIADSLPLPIPKPVFFGKPSSSFPWQFIGTTFLPGTTACIAHLTNQQRLNAAQPLALFLKHLHAIDATQAKTLGAGQDEIHRLEHAVRTPKTLENLHSLKSLNLITDTAPLEKLAQTWESIPSSNHQTLVHGDLYCRHIVVDDNNQVSGIIDWGDLHYGNPAIDLALIPQFLPPEAHQTFQDTYGPIDKDTWQLAKVRALYGATTLATYAHDTNDPDLLREALLSLTYIKKSL